MNGTHKRITENGRNGEKRKNGTTTASTKPSRIVTKWDQLNIIFEIMSQLAFMIGIHLICNEKQCSFVTLPDLSHFTNFSAFFNLEVFLYYLGYMMVLFSLNWFPIVNEKVAVKDFTFHFVGFNMFLIVIFSCLFLELIGIPVSYYMDQHIMHLVVSSMFFEISIGIFVYIYSFLSPKHKLNAQEIGTPFLSAFYNGRQVNPQLFNRINLKIFHVELITISSILIEFALMLRGLNLTDSNGLNLNNLNWKSLSSHPTLVSLVFFHSIYLVCHLYYESRMLSSYYFMSEGMGFNTSVATSSRFSGLLAQARYLKEHNIHYPNWQLVGLVSIFIFTFYIYNVTNTQKDHFRRYPNSPQSKKMKKITTSVGKDILCDGWWGIVRQPNIMADLLIHLTIIRFGFTVPPVLSLLSFFYYFILRARDSQRDCAMKYGSAWQEYCRRVKYVLVPFIY